MSRPDALSQFDSRRPKRVPTFHAEMDEIELLRSRLSEAESTAAAAIRERDALRSQLLRSGLKPKGGGRRPKPPEAGLPVPAIPPGGPLPLQGGAEAPLEFDD